VESIKSRVLISVNVHGSETIVMIGHHDCAGNPVSKEEHIRQGKECVKVLQSWKLPVKNILGVWINDNWTIEIIE
jgi:carbonic anhydrase